MPVPRNALSLPRRYVVLKFHLWISQSPYAPAGADRLLGRSAGTGDTRSPYAEVGTRGHFKLCFAIALLEGILTQRNDGWLSRLLWEDRCRRKSRADGKA